MPEEAEEKCQDSGTQEGESVPQKEGKPSEQPRSATGVYQVGTDAMRTLMDKGSPVSNVSRTLPNSFSFIHTWDPSQSSSLDETVRLKSRELEGQIATLRRQIGDQALALQVEQTSAQEKEQKIAELETSFSKLREKENLGFILSRVNQDAQNVLLQCEAFRSHFREGKEWPMFVMSIDIRRSTELMLKARSPEQFASFITTLCKELMKIVTKHYGIIDKFTGDGILAFFPDFFSGQDAGYYALTVADHCHQAFKSYYRKFRHSFNSILNDVGLGIGIDYGTAHLVQIADGLTVVGVPVVYACRMSQAPSGVTLLNHSAYEVISERFSANFFVSETNIKIKHEGDTVAFTVTPNGRSYTPGEPDWMATARKMQ